MRELPSVGRANRLLGLKQDPSLSMSSLFSYVAFMIILLGLFINFTSERRQRKKLVRIVPMHIREMVAKKNQLTSMKTITFNFHHTCWW
jgi:uncharacterized membrane protein